MSESPIERLIAAVDSLDVDATMALFAPDAQLLAADGRRAKGQDEVRALVEDLLGELRSAMHRVTGQWHQDNVWIAEAEAVYELRDGTQTTLLPRALVICESPQGVTDLHVYGAHERPLDDDSGQAGIRIGGRWIPAL